MKRNNDRRADDRWRSKDEAQRRATSTATQIAKDREDGRIEVTGTEDLWFGSDGWRWTRLTTHGFGGPVCPGIIEWGGGDGGA